MNQIDISFIIIEYYTLGDLKKCIESTEAKCLDLSYEIIVSSNSLYPSEKKSILLNDYKNVRWIFNGKNLGYAGAMNTGIEISSGKSVVIMNPDARIVSGSIYSAYKYLMANQDVGVIGPKIIDLDGKLQDSCRKFMTPVDLFCRVVKRVFLKKDVLLTQRLDCGKIQPVDWVIGAFMMLNKKAIEKVGLLDNRYFLYVEDMDWCKRFWDCGFKVVYFPNLVVEYKGDRKSISPAIYVRFINKYSIYHLRSYLRFMKKHSFYLYKNQ